MYSSRFKTPKWFYQGVSQYPPGVQEPFVTLVLEIEALYEDIDPLILAKYIWTPEESPEILGCKETKLHWIEVPIEIPNKRVVLARCTPNMIDELSMVYNGNNELFIEPSGISCATVSPLDIECDPYIIEYTWKS